MAARQIFTGIWVGDSTDRKPGFPTARSGNIFFERDTKAIYVLLQQWTKFGKGSGDVAWPDLTGDQSTVNLSGFNNDTGFLTSFTETDPVFGASPAAGITSMQIGNWDIAFGWGNHATQGYLTAEVNDLTAAVTWTNVPDANITESSVVQHEAALSIDADNIVANNTPTDGQVLSFDAASGNLQWVDPQIVSDALALTSISPTSGAQGDTVTATGTFDTSQAISFTVGGTAATSPTVVDSTTATFVVPAGSGAGNDVVATQGNESDTLAGAFEYTASAWTPGDITTLLWLDADDASTITESSGDITNWADKSGNSNDWSPPSTGIEPTLVSAGLNGLDTIKFDGVDDRLTGPRLSVKTIAMVAFWTDGTGDFRNILFPRFEYHGASASTGLMIENNFTQGNFEFGDGFKDGSALAHSQFLRYTSATVHIFRHSASWDIEGSGSQRPTETTRDFKGEYAEIIAMGPEESDATVEKLEGYLAHKWGLEANLPSGHPYKSSPP